MKAYLLTTLIVDHDELGLSDAIHELENTRYANRCISPQVCSALEFDIGEWNDSHPLNRSGTDIVAYLTSRLMPPE